MEKKRREKELSESTCVREEDRVPISAMNVLINEYFLGGMKVKYFKFLEEFGDGYLEYYSFDGFSIYIFDVLLKQDAKEDEYGIKDFLELSYLINGEQIIKVKGREEDIIYESQESYLVYLSKVSGTVLYNKNKYLKEIKIRMNSDFITNRGLHEDFSIKAKYDLDHLGTKFIEPICAKTQGVLTDIFSDQKAGALKRLFLESKILELLSMKLDLIKTISIDMSNKDNLVKKVYQVQAIIGADLTVQYSIHQLARQVGMNDFILKKEFKRVFGKTIFEYTIHERMKKAKKLLIHTKKPIYEISELVGYKNSTHFTAAFKKMNKLTPNKFRKLEVSVV